MTLKEPKVEIFSIVDDKNVPLYRVLWIGDVPHFCGAEDCTVEGRYEIRLDADESVFGTREERDSMLEAMEKWHRGSTNEDGPWS